MVLFGLFLLPVSAADTNFTISIAVPGSILDNAQSPELKSYLVGQVSSLECIVIIYKGVSVSMSDCTF